MLVTTIARTWWASCALALYVYADPTPTAGAEAPDSTGIQLPILTNKQALHPRNRNLEGDALVQWMDQEHLALSAKYNGSRKHKNQKAHPRQLVGIGDYGQDSFYFMPIGIGSPPRSVNVLMDTGSSDFWIADASCSKSSGCPSSMPLYDPSKSSSFKSSDRKFTTPYGDGTNEVSGMLGADDVTMAGYRVNGLTFGRVSRLTGSTIQPPASGLMGLGFESLSSSQSTPFWEVVALQGKVKDSVFSFQLASVNAQNTRQKVVPGGVFSLGVLDNRQYKGDIHWIKTANGFGARGVGYWAIAMDALEMNGKKIPLGNMNVVAVDTGTTLIGGPKRVLQEIYSQIPGVQPAPTSLFGGSGYYMYPCTQPFTLKFMFGGKVFQLNNENLNLGRLSRSSNMCVSSLFDAPNVQNSGMPAWILGDTFLRTVFTVFSWHPEQIGFASLPDDGVSTLPLTSISSGQTFAESQTPAAGGDDSATDQPSSSVKTINTQQTGLLGGSGLPTPSLASVPSGFSSLASLHSYGLDGKSGALAPYSTRLALGVALITMLVASLAL